jgi:hypothetical protein
MLRSNRNNRSEPMRNRLLRINLGKRQNLGKVNTMKERQRQKETLVGNPIERTKIYKDESLKIILMRHAEQDDNSGPHLSLKGKTRALALPPEFVRDFGKPVAIYAMKQHRDKTSNRPVETMKPLSKYFGVEINDSYEKNEIEMAIKEILERYKSGIVVLCWQHDELKDAAKQLGINNTPTWDSKDYDHFWVIQPEKKNLTVVPQRLLFGDSSH